MKTMCSLALVLALATASACAPKLDDPADVAAIKQLMDGYFKAASAKDLAELQAVLTDKTILIEPHRAPLVGKDAIGKLDEAFLAGFDAVAQGPAVDVRVRGDLAVAYGKYAETITPKDRTLAAENATGHWMAVLGRQGDGSWKWDWVIANSDQPPPGTTADGAEEQALLQIERDFVTAATKGDIAFFERTLAKDYTQAVDGKAVNVAAQFAELRSGAIQIASMTLRDLRIHVFGDAAIVSMVAESNGTYKGKAMSEKARGIDFFVKRDGRWQVVNSQMTTIKE